MTEATDYAKIKEDISTLKNDVASLIKLLEKEGLENVKTIMDDVKDKCDLGKVDAAVKKNPMESVAIAFAAGAFLALFLGRK
jgi:ElaB/YqjD/DUF883 family membrane-anchored ribosome-binding protein